MYPEFEIYFYCILFFKYKIKEDNQETSKRAHVKNPKPKNPGFHWSNIHVHIVASGPIAKRQVCIIMMSQEAYHEWKLWPYFRREIFW